MKTKIKEKCKLYFVTAMGAMAQGLFATLLIGTILGTLGTYAKIAFLTEIASYLGAGSMVVGCVIGVSMACAMKADLLVMLSSGVVGTIGYMIGTTITFEGAQKSLTAGPAGSFFAVIIAVEIGMLVSKKTKVDILVTPLVTILVGYGVAKLLSPAIAYLMYYLGYFVNTATEYQPFLMGIVVSVVVGMILTLPISSAAICAMIGISGLAGGAATVGCCAQMVGFAVMSFRENKVSGLVSQGLGTSMLQMGNIVKNPKIWIAPTLAGAIVAPLSTMVFHLECNGVNAGMGTCGLVGPIGMILATEHSAKFFIGLVLCCIVLPAVLSFVFGEIERKLGWIRENDLKLES